MSALGASKGGVARAAKLSGERRAEIARGAAVARWGRVKDADVGARGGGGDRARRGGERGGAADHGVGVSDGAAGAADLPVVRPEARVAAVEAVFAAFVTDPAVRQAIGRIPWGKFKAAVLAALEAPNG